ncbi:hypothetical protein, partial [Ralstonia solanacearum]|uniref:hypothetical protein n=1 Tax=Ralstonia solanacearum TaxID=305 RepID=UPI001E4DF694
DDFTIKTQTTSHSITTTDKQNYFPNQKNTAVTGTPSKRLAPLFHDGHQISQSNPRKNFHAFR